MWLWKQKRKTGGEEAGSPNKNKTKQQHTCHLSTLTIPPITAFYIQCNNQSLLYQASQLISQEFGQQTNRLKCHPAQK